MSTGARGPELRLFDGAALLSADGAPVKGAAAQSRRVAVLAVLAAAWPGTATRDRVIGLLWPENDDAGARRLLTQALYELRRELGPVIVGTSRDLAIDAAAMRVDVIDFRIALRDGQLERAVSLQSGPLLAGFHLKGAAEFERWLDDERETMRRELRGALESLVARDEGAGRASDAARWAERIVQLSPFDAEVVVRAVNLLVAAGDHGGALAMVGAYERRMRVELELEPAPQVSQLVQSLRATARAGGERAGTPRATVTAEQIEAARQPLAEASEPRPTHTRGGRGYARRLAIAAAGAALLAAAAFFMRPAPPPGALPPGPRRLLVAPITASGADPATLRIANEVSSALAPTLRGAHDFRLARDDEPQRWGTLRGQLLVTGPQLRIDTELRLDSDSGRPVVVTVTGSRDSVLALTERLAIALLPTLYPDASPPPSTLARFESAATLRDFLEGEAALRRGAFDDAFASFSAVTRSAPRLAYPWYRRALAAEMAHRSDDADSSIAHAEARAALLDTRERQLVHGYARWRAGDAPAAAAIFRALLRANSRDADAWFHFAEIAYHGGPLLGRSVDEARDAWRQVVALDSGNYSALMHSLRLEARVGDTAAVAALLRRPPLASSTAPSAIESRVIAAYGANSAAPAASVQEDLDALPDFSLSFLQGMVAGLLERPADAEAIAGRLTRASFPDVERAEGHLALANLAMARGRWREAHRQLGLAEPLNPVGAAWTRAYFATLPFLEVPAPLRDEAATRLAGAPRTPTTAPMSLRLAVDAPAAEMIERYLRALLDIRRGAPSGTPSPVLGCDTPAAMAPSTRSLCEDLQRGLAAEALRVAGRSADALREVESQTMLVPYQLAGRSMFFARSRERYLRATLLEQAGRLQEADDWYAAVPHGSWMDYVYLGPSFLRRGSIRERLGDPAGAAELYRRALAVWDDPDPELAALRRDAEAGLARTRARLSR